MRPTLLPGDRLLTLRTRQPRTGQLVVLGDPRQARRSLVKRVVAVERRMATVAGDNPAASTDSAVFGPAAVRARVLYRYHPPERAGRVR